MSRWDRFERKRDVEGRIARVDVHPDPVLRDREALVRELIWLIQAPWAMTTVESRRQIREIADKLEGNQP